MFVSGTELQGFEASSLNSNVLKTLNLNVSQMSSNQQSIAIAKAKENAAQTELAREVLTNQALAIKEQQFKDAEKSHHPANSITTLGIGGGAVRRPVAIHYSSFRVP